MSSKYSTLPKGIDNIEQLEEKRFSISKERRSLISKSLLTDDSKMKFLREAQQSA